MHGQLLLSRLFHAAKRYDAADLSAIFSEQELLCVRIPDREPYYVSIVSNAFAAYKGEEGLTAYLALATSEEDETFEQMEYEHAQRCLLAIYTEERADLEEQDLALLEESGVLFDGNVVQFRSKEPYQYPWHLSEEEQEDLLYIFEALLFAKEYFSSYGKEKQSDSLSTWLEAVEAAEYERIEYLPCFTAEGDSFVVSAEALAEEELGFVFPQAFFSDPERQQHFKRMRPVPGKILYFITGVLPEPLMGSKKERPMYPIFGIIYDPQRDILHSFSLVEEYEAEHHRFVSELLSLFETTGKAQAIHCFGRRSLPLLGKIGPQMGIMVVDGGPNARVEQLVLEMFTELFAGD